MLPQDSMPAMTTRRFLVVDMGNVENRGEESLPESQDAVHVTIGSGGSTRAASSARDACPASPLGEGQAPQQEGGLKKL